MSDTLITSYADYATAIDHVLALARRELDIFDHDLEGLKLEQPARLDTIARLLAEPTSRVRVVVQNAETVVARHPRLMRLLDLHGHHFQLVAASDKVAALTDAMLIVDGAHAVIRFHREQPRAKYLEDEPDAVKPYQKRFQAIVDEGGTPISTRVAGL